MHAAAVELLVEKANLEPNVALAHAEAIDMALKEAQLVTVPILDARFAESAAKVDSRFAAFEAKMDARFAESAAKMDARFAEMLVKIEQPKAELVRWLFLVVIGNAAISAVLNAVQRMH